jgi:hypothetical protein
MSDIPITERVRWAGIPSALTVTGASQLGRAD